MNNIITEKNKKRYFPHDINTRKYAVEMYKNCGDINYVCRNPRIILWELWAKLKREKGYTRTITALYKVMRKLNIKFYKGINIKTYQKRNIIRNMKRQKI